MWKNLGQRDKPRASGWRGASNLIFKAVSLILVLVVLVVIFKDYTGTASLVEKTFGAIVAFGSVLIVFFVVYMLLAPYRIDRDLRAELAELKSKQQPRLSFGATEVFERQATAPVVRGPALVLRIAVENMSDTPTLSCRGRVLKVEFGVANIFTPIKYSDVFALTWGRKSEGAEMSITIPPRLREWLEIAEMSARSGFRLRSVPASAQHGELLAEEGLYRFSVRVDADGCEPIEASVTVAVEGSGLTLNGQTSTLPRDW
jgi:hypothetical protein